MTESRLPIHLAILLGVSAGMYAGSLAVVTALQSATDQSVTDARAPLQKTIQLVVEGHDALDADLARASRAYGDAAALYDRLAPDLSALETSLEGLAKSTSKVSGAARALPGHVAWPAVTRTVVVTSRPATQATTRASGG
jgi:hypothetical protein